MSRTRVHIKSVAHVLQELSKQYRRADRGELPWVEAAAASRVLKEIRTTIEGDSFEARLSDMERLIEERLPTKRPNGHATSSRQGLRP